MEVGGRDSHVFGEQVVFSIRFLALVSSSLTSPLTLNIPELLRHGRHLLVCVQFSVLNLESQPLELPEREKVH